MFKVIQYLIEELQEYTDKYKDFVIIQGNYRRAIDPYSFNAINENLKQERFFPFPMN